MPVLTTHDRVALQLLQDPAWADEPDADDDNDDRGLPEGDETLRPAVLALAAHYFMEARSANNRTPDPVARFHLGNGARLERINWRADLSPKGLREAHGLMVNYLYEIKEIEKNHETFANTGTVVASRAVRALLRPLDKNRARPAAMTSATAAMSDSSPPAAAAASSTAPKRLPAPGPGPGPGKAGSQTAHVDATKPAPAGVVQSRPDRGDGAPTERPGKSGK